MTTEILPFIVGIAFLLCTTFTIPIIVLASLIFSWLNGLSSADNDTVNRILGGNFVVSIVFSLGGSVGWLLGLGIIWKFETVGALLMVLSTLWWLGCVISAQWKTEKLLSPYFDSIPGSRKGCHEINVMLGLVLPNVCMVGILVISLIIVGVQECMGNNQRAQRTYYPPRPVVQTTQTTTAAAATFISPPTISVEVPAADIEMGLGTSNATASQTSPVAKPNSVNANDAPNSGIQDGAG